MPSNRGGGARADLSVEEELTTAPDGIRRGSGEDPGVFSNVGVECWREAGGRSRLWEDGEAGSREMIQGKGASGKSTIQSHPERDHVLDPRIEAGFHPPACHYRHDAKRKKKKNVPYLRRLIRAEILMFCRRLPRSLRRDTDASEPGLTAQK
ncbi:NAD-dependent deacetylase [Marssonina coronariae]|uniref:NAD-dependent deacetylase n=1 Tax=Diplocarpon coronariae TaxID=2795749 RepID=A0A218ZEC8_9HELO|nr:NAD-dependent deacetylase [Marssonina coronariae]